ncbi:pilus assembly protein TadG-related protein [Cellulomonas sp. PhB143]|uniref:pilus assembly protein TadG-related protein n=1 Tax=Cellulomonas sp. PhB143 TaxID=2485186 RepID=UPI001F3A3792|nr:pilus assembly protein TadG-related protein [Cellulomonas sp. PhB143]
MARPAAGARRCARWLARRVAPVHGPGGEASAEDGRILLLATGFVALVLVLVTVVVSATAIHLDRTRLLDVADGAALAAADAVAEQSLYQGTAPPPEVAGGLVLTDPEVRDAVVDYLAQNPRVTAGLEDVALVEASTPDGRSARVVLTARSRPVLVSWATAPWSDGVLVRARSTARAW